MERNTYKNVYGNTITVTFNSFYYPQITSGSSKYQYHLRPKRIKNNCLIKSSNANLLLHKKFQEVKILTNGFCFLPWLGITSIITIFSFFIRIHTLHPSLLLLFVFIQTAVLLYRIYYKVISEKLLLVSDIGLQKTVTFYSGRQNVDFIPWVSIVDIVIAETISMQRILFYLAVLVKPMTSEQLEILPVFLSVWPRLACLKAIYNHLQQVLLFRSKSATPLN